LRVPRTWMGKFDCKPRVLIPRQESGFHSAVWNWALLILFMSTRFCSFWHPPCPSYQTHSKERKARSARDREKERKKERVAKSATFAYEGVLGGSVTSVSVNRWWKLELGCCVLRLRSSSSTRSRSLWGFFSVVICFSVVNFLLLSVGLCCDIWPELEVYAAESLGVWAKKEGNACERERESQREFLCFFFCIFGIWVPGVAATWRRQPEEEIVNFVHCDQDTH